MKIGTRAKTTRNQKLFAYKNSTKPDGKKMTLRETATHFGINMARTKYIYYREKKRTAEKGA